MDFKSMLQQLSVLSEATKETPTGRKHTAEPGGYGRKFDTDEEGEEKKDDKKEPAAKRGRGRPKKGADSDTGKVAKYDNAKNLQSFMIGNVPKKSKDLEKLPKKKHSLKEWVQEIEEKYVAEAAPGQQLTVKPMPGAAQLVDPATNKVMATGDAAAVKNIQGAVATGKVQMRGAGAQEMAEEGEGKKWIKGAIKHPGAFTKKAKSHGMTASEFAKKVLANKEDYPAKTEKQAVLAKTLSKLKEVEQPTIDNMTAMGAGLGAGRSQTTLEGKKDFAAKFQKNIDKSNKGKKETEEKVKAHQKDDKKKVEEAAKPDYIDLDKDGNKKETMKKAAADKKKKVNESAHRHSAAKLLGKAHALAKEAYNCKYDDLDEVRMYHEGYKEGLDECYGQGVYEMAPAMPPATMHGMAKAAEPAMEDEMEEGNAFTAALKATPKGEKFSVGGKTFTDRSNYESIAFESWDKELNDLLTESEEVTEGMTVSISKGQQGAPDSVSVSAQDGEADALLALIKQAGLGLFGNDKPNGFDASNGGDATASHGDIDVVGDHDGMMAIMKKLSGTGGDEGSEDYADEEGHDHDHEEACETCGESQCKCDEEVVDEVENYAQEEEQVAEDNPPDSGAAETTADENAEAAEDMALAKQSQQDKTVTTNEGGDGMEDEPVTEWANDAGAKAKDFNDEQFETDMKFMTKVISSGLNKEKSTGQTTVPVVASQLGRQVAHESISDWKKLAGI